MSAVPQTRMTVDHASEVVALLDALDRGAAVSAALGVDEWTVDVEGYVQWWHVTDSGEAMPYVLLLGVEAAEGLDSGFVGIPVISLARLQSPKPGEWSVRATGPGVLVFLRVRLAGAEN